MSGAFIAIVTFLYLCAAVSDWIQGNEPMALVWGAYALANVGLIWAGMR